MFRIDSRTALVLCLALSPSSALAQGVVDLIPGDALGYVAVRNPSQLDEKIQDFGRRLNAPIPSVVDMVKAQTGLSEGIDEGRALAAAVMTGSTGPTPVLFMPVDDYAAFVAQLGAGDPENGISAARLASKDVVVGEKNGYGVLTGSQNRQLLAKILSADVNPPDGAAGDAAKLAAEYDMVLVIFDRGLQVFCTEALKGLKQAKASLAAQMGDDNPALAGIEVYVRLVEAIKAEVAAAAVGVELQQGGGVRFRDLAWFKPDGKVAPMLANATPYQGDFLAGLPEIPYVVVGGATMPEGSMEAMMDFSGSMMKSMSQTYGMSSDQIDEMMELSSEYFTGMHGMSFVLGVGEGQEPLYSSMMGVMQVDDAKGFVQRYREFWEKLQDLADDGEGGMFANAELEQVEVNGVAALKVTMPIDNFQGFMPGGTEQAMQQMLQKMYGADGVITYIAPGGDKTVYAAYTDTELLTQAMQATKNATGLLSQSDGIAATAQLLPSDAFAIAYWSPRGTVAFATRMIGLMAGGMGPQIPPFPETPPIGAAVTVDGVAVQIDSVVPAEVVDALGDYIEQIKQMGAGPPQDTVQ